MKCSRCRSTIRLPGVDHVVISTGDLVCMDCWDRSVRDFDAFACGGEVPESMLARIETGYVLPHSIADAVLAMADTTPLEARKIAEEHIRPVLDWPDGWKALLLDQLYIAGWSRDQARRVLREKKWLL